MRHSDTICLSWLPQAATDEYIEREDVRFQEAAELLLRGLDPSPEQAASAAANALRLGEPARSPFIYFCFAGSATGRFQMSRSNSRRPVCSHCQIYLVFVRTAGTRPQASKSQKLKISCLPEHLFPDAAHCWIAPSERSFLCRWISPTAAGGIMSASKLRVPALP